MNRLFLISGASFLLFTLASCGPPASSANPAQTEGLDAKPTVPAGTIQPTSTYRPPSPGVPSMLPFEVKATTDKVGYLPGEPAQMAFTLRNTTGKQLSMIAFPPRVQIVGPKPHQAYRSIDAGTESRTVMPEEAATFSINWDQKDEAGRQVPFGWYSVEVTVTLPDDESSATGAGSFTLTPARLLVQYPEGILTRTIEVGQSATSGNITVMLESLEMSFDGIVLNTFSRPPDYVWETGPIPPHRYAVAEAEYSFDGGPFIAAGTHSGRFPEDGIYQTFAGFNPLPANARELTFRITRFADTPGIWEFHVKLQQS